MASLDKTSVREEFGKIKGEFNQLRANGKVSAEIVLLFTSLFTLVELILSIFLEKTTSKTSKNSSKPSSQTAKDNTALTGNHGHGKTLNSEVGNNTRLNEKTTVLKVLDCNICGEDLSRLKCVGHERRTKIDIVFEKVVEHVDAEIKICPSCEIKVKADFPSEMNNVLQYGAGLKAYVINLIICQMLPLKRVGTMLKTLFAVVLSEATMLKFILRLYLALEKWEIQSIEYLLQQGALHVDETSLRVEKKNYWIHVYSSGEVTLKFLHPQRGGKAMEEIEIIPRYGGAIIHDCWGSYLAYSHCEHGLCGSHLLRELTFVIESNNYAWAKNMKKLLKQTCRKVATRKRKILTSKEYAVLQKRYRNILTRGQNELPLIPEKTTGKRGRIAKSDAHNLWERLKMYEESVLLFARNPHVPFTNNRAERDLRMAKVKQKVSGCFRNPVYAKAYCRISSYLQTMANKGVNPFIAIQTALAGNL